MTSNPESDPNLNPNTNIEDVNLFEEAPALRKAFQGSGTDIKGARSNIDTKNIVNADRRNKPKTYIMPSAFKTNNNKTKRRKSEFFDNDPNVSNISSSQSSDSNENLSQQLENLSQQPENLSQQPENLSQQPENLSQQPENLSQQKNLSQQQIIDDMYNHADSLGKVPDVQPPQSSQSNTKNAPAQLNPAQQTSLMNAIQTLIPNELSIIINTSVPGFQIINYKPIYSFPKIKTDNKIYFDPLVKLQQKIIDEVPKEIRSEQFCLKGYFQSLLNYHGIRKNMTLQQATEEGFVDDNIETTLENLFPAGGHFYVGGQTYSIVDALWIKGSWKIDKQLIDIGQLNNIRTQNPLLFNSILTNLINNDDVNQLPPSVRYGNNYTGTIQQPSSATNTAPAVQTAQTGQNAQAVQQIQQFQQQLIQQANPTRQNLQIGYQPPQPILTPQQIEQILNSGVSQKMMLDLLSGNVPITKLFSGNNNLLQIENDTQLVEENTAVALLGRENLRLSQQSTNNIRDYFGHYTTSTPRRWINNENYYFLCNQVFHRLEPNIKNLIQTFYNNTTKTNIVFGANNVSKDAYSDSIRGISVITSSADGNCFFHALTQGINHYNLTANPRIIYNIYGASQQFTQLVLRNIVAEYLIRILRTAPQDQIERIYMGPFNSINELNQAFRELLGAQLGRPVLDEDLIHMPENEYIALCNAVFQNYFAETGSTFLVKQVTAKPANADLQNPFTIFQANEQPAIRNYINSANYWADELSIKAIRETLGLNIFIISNRYNANNPIGLEIYRGPDVVPRIYTPQENSDVFDRYMFLYNEGNHHYELVTFTYYNKQKNQMQISIFETNLNIMPPLHIIFFLYSYIYLNLTIQQKSTCLFMNQIFISIDRAVQEIGREFDGETTQILRENVQPDPNNMMPGRGLNIMGMPETQNCKFIRLMMNMFRPNGNVIIRPAVNGYTNYYFNTWRRFIGQYRYNIWYYRNNIDYRDNNALGNNTYFKLVPDHNMRRGTPGNDNQVIIQNGPKLIQNAGGKRIIQKGGQYSQFSQYNYPKSASYLTPNDQYYQALINLNNAQNLPYLTNAQINGIMSNFSNLKKTNISYQITIDLELQKGENLTAISIASAKCRNKWNQIRKLYSEIFNLKYTIPPVYENLLDNPLYKKSKDINSKEKDYSSRERDYSSREKDYSRERDYSSREKDYSNRRNNKTRKRY
jgi:hypothetical protein